MLACDFVPWRGWQRTSAGPLTALQMQREAHRLANFPYLHDYANM